MSGVYNELVKAAGKSANNDSQFRWGYVKVDSPLEVRLIGETANQKVKKLSTYSPTLNDYVMLTKDSNTLVCVGKVE